MNADLSSQEVAWLDQEHSHTARMIRKHGVALTYVGGDSTAHKTSFAYTVGLYGIGHPELLVLGSDPGTASGLLNEVAGRVRSGADLVPGEILEFAQWPHRVLVEEVPNPGDILFAANGFYDRPPGVSVPALQLTYDDRAGRFPTDEGYDIPSWVQPRPGEFSAWD
ncbi:MAG TPA: DUF4262 domain-containing protein [Pseudolysinimonas sp.]|nr:DUF4262 domain-containing protein [Pseudolysinimonas sp.]